MYPLIEDIAFENAISEGGSLRAMVLREEIIGPFSHSLIADYGTPKVLLTFAPHYPAFPEETRSQT